MKKICICILASSLEEKYLNRLKLIQANIIRSFNHQLFFHFLGEGEKPSFLNPSWEWHDFSIYPGEHRYIYALINKIANPDYDYVIFCDDDVAIDIDKFVNLAIQYDETPSIFTCHPGMYGSTREIEAINLYASKYIKGRDIKNMWMGFTTSIINKKLCEKIFNNYEILESLIAISKHINENEIKFIGDLQICILAWLLEAHCVPGLDRKAEYGATCWPAYGCSSLFCEGGNHYHIHHTASSKFIPTDTLIKVLEKAPFKFYEDLVSELFPIFTKGINVNDWANINFSIKLFWAPWSYFGVINDICYEQKNVETSISLNDNNHYKYKDGFILKRNPINNYMDIDVFDINFQWTYENYIIGIPIRKKEITFLNQFENSIVVVGIKD